MKIPRGYTALRRMYAGQNVLEPGKDRSWRENCNCCKRTGYTIQVEDYKVPENYRGHSSILRPIRGPEEPVVYFQELLISSPTLWSYAISTEELQREVNRIEAEALILRVCSKTLSERFGATIFCSGSAWELLPRIHAVIPLDPKDFKAAPPVSPEGIESIELYNNLRSNKCRKKSSS